jgi:hypothetical protein
MTGHNRHKRRNLEADAARADGIADRAARDDRHVMFALCKSSGVGH